MRARVEHLLGRRLRFTLRSDANGERDERVVTGTFQCLDRHRNFILRDASELRIFKVGAGVQRRRRALGAALVCTGVLIAATSVHLIFFADDVDGAPGSGFV